MAKISNVDLEKENVRLREELEILKKISESIYHAIIHIYSDNNDECEMCDNAIRQYQSWRTSQPTT